MFNRIEAYAEAGKRAAQAVNDQDGTRAAEEKRYFIDMFLCEEVGPDRVAAHKAFDAAYSAARKVKRVTF